MNGKTTCKSAYPDFDEALVFYDWADAESILEYLNDEFSDCYQLITL